MKSEIRKDYVQEKYVIIAPKRGGRPSEYKPEPETAGRSTCFFCPENIQKKEIIQLVKTKKPWEIAVLKNKFPAVSLDNPKAYGLQEVIVETPHRSRQLEELPVSHLVKLLKTYADRTRDILKQKKIQYLLIFKNNGGRAGASIRHAHSQIFATAFIPPHLRDKSEKVLEYKLRYGTCVYCDVIKRERLGPRLVAELDGVIAFTPYASIHNYEIWILPTRHLDNITDLNLNELRSWAIILKKILEAISRLGLSYNFYFHEVVFDENQHLYMKITPRGSVWAGVEIGSGIIINPIAPEEAARYYRRQFKTNGLSIH
ncbi:DUF4931 domain-containing protein [Candidatus Uhrbacteria bacterium]|nr:DUF4931 domain-containing protein [Candidatus Uhrbacteria bacterium]